MLPWKLRKCQILPVNQNLSSVYFSLAKFQLVSCNPSLAMIWQMTYYTHKLPKLCSSATLNMLHWLASGFNNFSIKKSKTKQNFGQGNKETTGNNKTEINTNQ